MCHNLLTRPLVMSGDTVRDPDATIRPDHTLFGAIGQQIGLAVNCTCRPPHFGLIRS